MDVTAWLQNKYALGVNVICCCLTATNQIFEQTLDTIWPYCYLTGPGDLDISLKPCACGLFLFFCQKPLLPSYPSLMSYGAVGLISSHYRERI